MKSQVYLESIAKHRRQPGWKLREVLDIEKALLLELGYLEADPQPARPRSLRRRLKAFLFPKIQKKKIAA